MRLDEISAVGVLYYYHDSTLLEVPFSRLAIVWRAYDGFERCDSKLESDDKIHFIREKENDTERSSVGGLVFQRIRNPAINIII